MASVYYVDVTTGNDTDDGSTELLAWATLAKAADTATTIGDKVWVKASASYVVQDGANDCVMQITNTGSNSLPIIYEGYTDTPGDNGVVTIDADANTLASPVACTTSLETHYSFTNFRFTGGSNDGFNGNGTVVGFIKFVNCRFDNNDVHGLNANGYITARNCQFDANGTSGVTLAAHLNNFTGCKIFGNGAGMSMGRSTVIGCLLYDNGGSVNLNFTSYGCIVMNNTIDGDNVANSVGIRLDANIYGISTVMNNILFDLAFGVDSDYIVANGGTENWDYNLYYDNVDDYENNNCEGPNDVSGTGDPFTASATRDYTLKSGSEAIDAGFDLGKF